MHSYFVLVASSYPFFFFTENFFKLQKQHPSGLQSVQLSKSLCVGKKCTELQYSHLCLLKGSQVKLAGLCGRVQTAEWHLPDSPVSFFFLLGWDKWHPYHWVWWPQVILRILYNRIPSTFNLIPCSRHMGWMVLMGKIPMFTTWQHSCSLTSQDGCMIAELAVWEWTDNMVLYSFNSNYFKWQAWYEASMFVLFSGTSLLLLSAKSDISELSDKCSSCNYDLAVDMKGIYKTSWKLVITVTLIWHERGMSRGLISQNKWKHLCACVCIAIKYTIVELWSCEWSRLKKKQRLNTMSLTYLLEFL